MPKGFATIDTDGDGALSAAEMAAAGLNYDAAMDQDGDGAVSKAEFDDLVFNGGGDLLEIGGKSFIQVERYDELETALTQALERENDDETEIERLKKELVVVRETRRTEGATITEMRQTISALGDEKGTELEKMEKRALLAETAAERLGVEARKARLGTSKLTREIEIAMDETLSSSASNAAENKVMKAELKRMEKENRLLTAENARLAERVQTAWRIVLKRQQQEQEARKQASSPRLDLGDLADLELPAIFGEALGLTEQERWRTFDMEETPSVDSRDVGKGWASQQSRHSNSSLGSLLGSEQCSVDQEVAKINSVETNVSAFERLAPRLASRLSSSASMNSTKN